MIRAAMLMLMMVAGEELAVGAKAPAFSLDDAVAGTAVAMTPDDGNIKAIVFTSGACAEAKAFEARLIEIANRFGRQGVKFYVLDPAADTERAREQEYPFAYLKDADGAVARAYGVRVAPQAFVVDGAGVLRYRGFIDDSPLPRVRKTTALTDALGALVNGRDPLAPDTKPFGCARITN